MLASWTQVFEQDLLAGFGDRAKETVTRVIEEIDKTAPAGLKDRCATQAEQALKESKVSNGSFGTTAMYDNTPTIRWQWTRW